jgi:hypothetical protein
MKINEVVDYFYGLDPSNPSYMHKIGPVYGKKNLKVPRAKLHRKKRDESFADGKKPGRKGLSKRVGISQKMSISKLAKIAKTATGERKRMAQWNLNMKRGRAKKK